MKTITELARKSGFVASVGKTDKKGKYRPFINALSKDVPIEWLQRFHDLSITHYQEGLLAGAGELTDKHNHPEPHTMKWTQLEMDYINKRVAAAVAIERERCAKVCERIDAEYEGEDVQATWCAAAIRRQT